MIQNNEGRKDKRLWTENEEGDKVEFHQFLTGYEESEYITGDITWENANMRTVPFCTVPMPSPVSLRKNF